MKLRALILILLFAFSPHGASADVSRACGKFYNELSGFALPANLNFLPADLREEVGRLGAVLRGDERAGGRHAFAFHPELKRLVDALEARRVGQVDAAVKMRAARRVLRDRLLKAQRENKGTPAQLRFGLERLARIERDLGKNSDELDSLVRTTEPFRQALGLGAIAEGAQRASKELNAVIVLHDVHPAAAGQLTGDGVGKTMSLKFKSSDLGVIAGLTPYDQGLSKIRGEGAAVVAANQAKVEQALDHGLVRKRKHRVGSLVAVKREGTVKFVDEDLVPIKENEIAWVLEDTGLSGGLERGPGRDVVTSDVDPAAFGFARKGAGAGSRPGLAAGARPSAHPSMGIITEQEREVVLTFNHRVEELLGHKNERLRYMTHGAENRNPISEGPVGYPLSAFLPSGERRVIERGPAADPDRNYRTFVREMWGMGYEIPVNPRWGWEAAPAKPLEIQRSP